MRILLTGADGQLGRELQPLLSGRGELLCTTLEGVDDSEVLDLTDESAIGGLLERFRPELVFNAAAFTAVDLAESEPGLAEAVNAAAPGIFGAWAMDHDAGVIHFSTDYVFDGRKGAPYVETDHASPLNVYGRTKLAGEQALGRSGCRHVVMRTSWVYASHGQNFVLKMLELAQERDELAVVSDQVGRPTWAANLARYAMATVDAGVLDDPVPDDGTGTRLLHACDAGAMSWFEFAHLIFETAVTLGLLGAAPKLREVGSDAFPTVAKRPASSVLGTGRLRSRVGIDPASVKDSLRVCLGELTAT